MIKETFKVVKRPSKCIYKDTLKYEKISIVMNFQYPYCP